MNTDYFKNQIEALGDMWGTPHRGLFTTIHNKWDIDIYKNGLKEELIKFQSKSVPINEIFLKPNLIGKNYLIYKKRNLRDFGGYKQPSFKMIGLLQSSEIDFDDFQYCYLVADESGSILIGENRINFSNKPNRKDKFPEVTEEYKEKQRIAFLEEFFRGKIWKGCYALDLSYLIGESGSVFMNWNSNPLEGEK